MTAARYAKSYRAMAIATATPGQLILMLFDGALRSMGIAVNAFNDPNLISRNETIHNKIINAQDILRELQTSLDMKAPGDFSPRMYALYDFMIRQLQQANMRKDPEPIRTVERLLGTIRDAWAQMLERHSDAAPTFAAA
jgi:flagellar protein FliS